MKKYFVSFILGLLLISSCVKDDICIEATTPNLIIRFYDITDTLTVKKTTKLTVWAIGKDSIYTEAALDSIILPINLNGDDTTYKFVSDTFTDSLKISYTKKDVFVSRSCGYKTIFQLNTTNAVELTADANNWIQNIQVSQPNITNENEVHIKIYF